MQLRSHRGPEQLRNLNENAGAKWEGEVFLSFSRSLQVSSIAPSATRSPRRPDDQAPPRGDAGQEQPGIEGRPEQKIFFTGAELVSFFVFSNVLHLLYYFGMN